MAYREFYQAANIDLSEQTDMSPITRGISNLFLGIAEGQRKREQKANDFNYTLEKGAFDSDIDLLREIANNVTNREVTRLRSGKPRDQETEQLKQLGLSYQQKSQQQYKRLQNLSKQIEDMRQADPYYDPTSDFKRLNKINSYDVNFLNRDTAFDEIEPEIGKVSSNPEENTFRYSKYRADYVKNKGNQYKERTTGSPNATKTIYDQATFWTPEGKVGVTDEHAIDFLESDKRVNMFFEDKVMRELDSEVKKMKASGDERVAWMKGLSDEEIKNELINDASKNIINQTDYGVRKRELAKKDLSEADRINSKVDFQYKKDASSGPVKNDSIGHSDTFYNQNIGVPGASGSTIAGPGGVLMTKKGVNPGKPIVIDADSRRAYNMRSGKNLDRSRGKFNITGYQLQPYTTNGDVYPISANSTEELIEKINSLPDDAFQNLSPEMKIGIQGYAIDQAKMLGDIATKSEDLSNKLGDAIENGDEEEADRLRGRIAQLASLRNSFNLPDVYDEDIINAASSAGIKPQSIRVDQLLLADKSDLDKIRTITDGLDLTDKKNWSPDMKAVNEAFQARWNKAQVGRAGEVTNPEKKSKKETTELKDSYNINGKSYSLQQLKDLGYTEDQIKEAVKLGNIN